MEIQISHEVGTSVTGATLWRHRFINIDKTNYLVKAHSYFTKDERKEAKLNWKLAQLNQEE